MTVNSRVIKTFLAWSPDAVDVPLMNGLRIQILPSLSELPRARKAQSAAFIASEALLVVWDDEPENIVHRAKSIESELMELVWRTGETEMEEGEKKGPTVAAVEIDPESGEILPEKRATHLQNTVLVSLTLIIICIMLGAGFREVAVEVAVDHRIVRLAFLALTPVQVFFTLVSKSLFDYSLPGSQPAVFCASYCRLYRSVYWTHPTNAAKLAILFRSTSSTIDEPNLTPRHNSVPRI